MMERTNSHKTPDAILCADIHLRENTPVCRTDEEFQIAQWKKLSFIKDLQETYQCPVLMAGDLYDHWKTSPWLLTQTTNHLPKQLFLIFGNHDLPQHSLELQDKCGVYNLWNNKALEILPGTHWGEEPKKKSFKIKGRKILVYHTMTYQGKLPWPGCVDPKASKLLRKYPKFDLLLCGHNHQAFTETHEGRLLVNPGSMMRQDADQIDFRPRVYLYYADSNTVKPVFLPILPGVVSREHLDKITERDGRISAFVSKLNDDWSASLNFRGNLEEFFKNNTVRSSVKKIVYKSLD